MAAASPEFFKPADAFSPRLHLLAAGAGAEASDGDDGYYRCCRTPAGAGTGCLGQAATCPPAPRKPRAQPDAACRKRLFGVEVISLRFDDLDAIFRPSPPPPCDDHHNNNEQQRQRSRRALGRLAAGRSSRAGLN
ncbi:cyclin-dependent protein kinase inhibitor SMR1-like [Triticum dicoccoides]|uniref:cyclin-dependent protein kinase inhibitor SMR1-like n=1 Tax=Triticum dicoccoides TaxID=85692 RepID=UPI00188F5560|nr:cyclin-dependent protein kinase inhibitor SMR1-like [Triticum dicoccoides]